jgi:hypothetical protein
LLPGQSGTIQARVHQGTAQGGPPAGKVEASSELARVTETDRLAAGTNHELMIVASMIITTTSYRRKSVALLRIDAGTAVAKTASTGEVRYVRKLLAENGYHSISVIDQFAYSMLLLRPLSFYLINDSYQEEQETDNPKWPAQRWKLMTGKDLFCLPKSPAQNSTSTDFRLLTFTVQKQASFPF